MIWRGNHRFLLSFQRNFFMVDHLAVKSNFSSWRSSWTTGSISRLTGDIALRWQRLFYESCLWLEKRRRLALFVVIPSAIDVVVWINDNFICTQYNIAKFCWYIRVSSAKQDDITRSSRCWVTASLLSIFLLIDGPKIGLKFPNGQAEASLLCLL